MMDLKKLLEDKWELTPERFSGLAFLHRGQERILWDTRNACEILRYTSHYHASSKDSQAKTYDDWQELQQRLSEIAR